MGSLRCSGHEKVKKAMAWQGKTTTLHVHHTFLYISLLSLHNCHMKIPNFTFCERCKQAMTKFSFSSWTWIWLIEIQLQKSLLAFDKVSELDRNWKSVNSFLHATFLWLSAVVVSFKNSLIFTQDVTDASVNTCCKLKLVFLEKRL